MFLFAFSTPEKGKIDREALVGRHKVEVDSINILTPLTVGNGRFAFTADFTGLQSFPQLYENGIPLGTQSEWGWHSFPNSQGYKFEESLQDYDYYGRKVLFSVQVRMPERSRDAVNYLRMNPHRLHLGIVGLEFLHPDGSVVSPEEITSIDQVLDPWTGKIHSSFLVGNIPVEVTTYSHQAMDLISSKIASPLVKQGLIRIRLAFPYPTGQNTDSGSDWKQPEKHRSELVSSSNSAVIKRIIDSTSYSVKLEWKGSANIREKEKHVFYLEPGSGESEISFSCLFTPGNTAIKLPDFKSTAANNEESWEKFWMTGGAVDLSGSTDPRAPELERRIVLSQYLTRVQSAGSYPPQETGLTYNSWHGKFHLEMHYWHSAHFALWGRTDLLERSLGYYSSIIDKARETAQRQGFDGVRWPKMTSPTGIDSPSGVGSFLIWQQPHIIYMAELCYRNTHNESILRKYADVVFNSADFMASFAKYDAQNNRYVLGPPMIPAQESFPAQSTYNSPFELVYWQWKQTWGWDFPMVAMEATRLSLPEKAIDALFMDVESNTYLPNGHNFQNQRLKLYLPGNGALLTAVALMCAGWDGAPEIEAPGFPKNGKWNVKWEGLKKLP